jgi:thiol-disulfide isomerase/thioredoxin
MRRLGGPSLPLPLLAVAALLLPLLPLCAPAGPYDFQRDGVLVAVQQTFEDVVVYSKQLTIVVFYSPACPHCTRLEPEVKEAAKQLAEDGIKVVAVDAVQQRGFADYYNVTGYPTVFTFVPPEKATSHAGGEVSACARRCAFGLRAERHPCVNLPVRVRVAGGGRGRHRHRSTRPDRAGRLRAEAAACGAGTAQPTPRRQQDSARARFVRLDPRDRVA